MTTLNPYRLFDTAFRAVVLVVSLLLLAFLVMAGAKSALAASLKAGSILTGDTLTVGDIFDNAGRNADYVLGPAPQPGKDMVLNAPTLMRIAMALDLPWTPQSSADQIVISRAATVIPADQVRNAIVAGLREKGLTSKFTLDTGAAALEINLPHDLAATLDVTNISYNIRTSRFEALVSAPSAANPVKQMTISGTVREITLVPVLKKSLRNGDLIGDSDLDWVELYSAEIQPDMMLRSEDLVGMTPRRMAMAGKPLRMVDLQAPQLVERGENVTIVFNEGPLNLTASGKALQNGAKGDIIRVMNNSSNRPLDAIVSASREVVVSE